MRLPNCQTIDCIVKFFSESIWIKAKTIEDLRKPFDISVLIPDTVIDNARAVRPGGIWIRKWAWYDEPIEFDLDSSYVQMMLNPYFCITNNNDGLFTFCERGLKLAELKVLGRRVDWEDWIRLRAEIKDRMEGLLVVTVNPIKGTDGIALTWIERQNHCSRRIEYITYEESLTYDSDCSYSIHKVDDALKYGVLMKIGLIRRFGDRGLFDIVHALSRLSLEYYVGYRYASLLVDSLLVERLKAREVEKRLKASPLSWKREELTGKAYWRLAGGLVGVKGLKWYDVRIWYINNDGYDTRIVRKFVEPALQKPRLKEEDWTWNTWAYQFYHNFTCERGLKWESRNPVTLGTVVQMVKQSCEIERRREKF